MENIIKTFKDLSKYKTIKGDTKEFKKLFKFIDEYFKDTEYNIEKYEFRGIPAYVISNSKDKFLDIILSGHIDIVPADTYEIKEDDVNLYGRGSIDMKGSVSVMMEILKNNHFDKKIALFITGDEEEDGYSTKELLKSYSASLAIIPDGGSNFDLIKEEKGLLQIRVSISTPSAHSSQPFNGKNAIQELIKIYEALIDKYPIPTSSSDYKTSVNLSIMNGGTANNQVPGYAEMVLDIRYVSSDKIDDFIKLIKDTNKDAVIDVILTGNVFTTDLNNKSIKDYIVICEDILKRKINIVGCESTSDGVYFSDINIPTIIMNPEGYYAHSPKEYVNKKSLSTLYNIYLKFLKGDE